MLFLPAMTKVMRIEARERLHHFPSLILWLFKTIAIPAALHGRPYLGQVWSTPFLQNEKAQQQQVFKKQLYSM
jgi:hypothetical protein